MILSPHGALFCAFLDTINNFSGVLSSFPPVGASVAFMVAESAMYLAFVLYSDAQATTCVSAQSDPSFNPEELMSLEPDVIAERDRADAASTSAPLYVHGLRKVFPPKVAGRRAVTAVENLTFGIEKGEIFGLLGANGAGKTTALSMLTRHMLPTAGDAFVSSFSILSQFSLGATHLGVVTQNNSLWERLSVEDHLFLFARLRGVPEDLVRAVVNATIDQLELYPHRHKLSMKLSGGMKRKLCVAIALIGDPDVVLLDEPSAGLDPVSRRNLWTVILKTMSHRSVILTTHSMDEAEALCKRIGIMVQGQLRVLGTKQHLKSKFGSGFELTVKLRLVRDCIETQKMKLTGFVNSLFPTAHLITENSGLLTYHIAKEEMDMGRIFTELEQRKHDLCIEDYTVAHPTLEQVFIRTVNQFTPPEVPKRSSQIEEDGDEVVVEVNKLGCTDFFVRVMIVVTASISIVLWLVGLLVFGSSIVGNAVVFLGVLSILVSCVGCNLLCCTCCRNPKGSDD